MIWFIPHFLEKNKQFNKSTSAITLRFYIIVNNS